MAGAHPIHVHPARPFYRISAKLLGASMWFFLMYRAKKDGVYIRATSIPWDGQGFGIALACFIGT